MTETIRYAIELTDGGYASFYQEYDDADVHILSKEDILEANHYSEYDEVHKEFEELIKYEGEDYSFAVGVRPLKIVRLIIAIKVEEHW